jgi:hypothetical protein
MNSIDSKQYTEYRFYRRLLIGFISTVYLLLKS